jgi:uncharacterized protein YjbI with pentapeptide repeats
VEALLTGSITRTPVHRQGIQIVHAIMDEPIDLKNAVLPYNTRITNSLFREQVNFLDATAAGSIDLSDSTIAEVLFTRAKIKGALSIHNVHFQGRADFSSATLEEHLDGSRAEFDEAANFDRIRVERMMIFEGGAKFHKGANFEGAKVGDKFSLNDAVIEASSNFKSMKIDESLFAQRAKFLGNEALYNFDSMKVGGQAEFQEAVFEGDANFVMAEIGRQFVGDRMRFLNPRVEAAFNQTTIHGSFHLEGAVFESAANFRLLAVGRSLNLSGAEFRNTEAPGAIKVLPDDPPAKYNADFRGATIAGAIWLDGTKFAGEVRMSGATYLSIYGKKLSSMEENWRVLEQYVDQWAYSADTFTVLGEFFKKQGYPQIADKIYMKQRETERKHLTWLGRLWSWLLEYLVGYGRHPEYSLVWSALVVSLGWFLFRDGACMERQDLTDQRLPYQPFWYSLDVFLPLTQLHAAGVWRPKPGRKGLWLYMRLHHLLGWVLSAFGTGAVTGLLE